MIIAQIIRIFVAAVLGLGLLVVVVGYMLPSHIRVERSTVVDQSPDVVFEHVNSLEAFSTWSLWFQIDPMTKLTFEGPATGVGARLLWDSHDPQVGKGNMEIIASQTLETVRYAIAFEGMGAAETSFILDQTGPNQTELSWVFATELGGALDRYMSLVMPDIIGEAYETGLENLKVKLSEM